MLPASPARFSRCPWFQLLRLGATLVTMNDITQQPGPGADDDSAADDPDGRLAAYVARTQTALDLLALATLWIVVVPPGDFGTSHDARALALTIRVAVSVVYGIDIDHPQPPWPAAMFTTCSPIRSGSSR